MGNLCANVSRLGCVFIGTMHVYVGLHSRLCGWVSAVYECVIWFGGASFSNVYTVLCSSNEHAGKVGSLLGGFDTPVSFHSEHKI